MRKYPQNSPNSEICQMRLSLINKTLKKYNVGAKDMHLIANIITDLYKQLDRTQRNQELAEAYILDELGEDAAMDFFKKVIAKTSPPGEHLKDIL